MAGYSRLVGRSRSPSRAYTAAYTGSGHGKEAVASIREVEAAHAPTGYRAKTMDSVIIIDDLPRD